MSDLRTLVEGATDEQIRLLERLDDVLNAYGDQRCQRFRLDLSAELAKAAGYPPLEVMKAGQ
jgi:hypothetical protein